ncbi:MAG TPA: hypothetical protein VGX28_12835 [Frankiaceae bacterium]|jgi:hypothetical protein|nr:hypothetical protein [Frankiaceae bacterium]
MRRLLVPALLAAGLSGLGAVPASAACDYIAKVPSYWTPFSLSGSGPYVEGCNFTCTPLVSTPAQSVPGVLAVGSAYVNNCL